MPLHAQVLFLQSQVHHMYVKIPTNGMEDCGAHAKGASVCPMHMNELLVLVSIIAVWLSMP